MICGEILVEPAWRHKAYQQGRSRFPLATPKWGPLTKADAYFKMLQQHVPVELRAEKRVRRSWISEATWRLVDERAALLQVPNHDRTYARRLSRQINQSFKADRTWRVQVAGIAIDVQYRAGNLKEAYEGLGRWYNHAVGHTHKPTQESLEAITSEFRDLYTARTPPGGPIPVHVGPFSVDDSCPSEEEIAKVVGCLRPGRASGASGMRLEHLKGWLEAATRKERPDRSAWEQLVTLVQHAYETGEIPSQVGWTTMVLLPKGSGEYRGIGLLETVWKLLSSIIDARLKAAIHFHDALHGFRASHDTSTAIFEAKLFQQLATVEQVPLYEVFIDLQKAYNALDRGRALEIMELYGVGGKALRLIRQFWDQMLVVARQAGFFGVLFLATRGLMQGDMQSPTIFNIVTDAIV
jgi:hypothetical protein